MIIFICPRLVVQGRLGFGPSVYLSVILKLQSNCWAVRNKDVIFGKHTELSMILWRFCILKIIILEFCCRQGHLYFTNTSLDSLRINNFASANNTSYSFSNPWFFLTENTTYDQANVDPITREGTVSSCRVYWLAWLSPGSLPLSRSSFNVKLIHCRKLCTASIDGVRLFHRRQLCPTPIDAKFRSDKKWNWNILVQCRLFITGDHDPSNSHCTLRNIIRCLC